jgi:hypothetical protein
MMLGVSRRRSSTATTEPSAIADQRVMGLVVLGGGKEGLVGRDQRQVVAIGEFDAAPPRRLRL